MTLDEALKQHFGYKSFRPLQREIVEAAYEEFVSNLAVERFNAAVLRRFAGCNKVQPDISFSSPAQHRMAGEFRTVVRSKTGSSPP